MPAPYTLPPDTRAIGTGNPPADVNAHTDALIAMGAAGNVCAYGADSTGSADSAAAFNSALASLPTINGLPAGLITWPPGTYKVGTGAAMNNSGPYVKVRGNGPSATIIKYYGAGDCVRVFNPIVPVGDIMSNPEGGYLAGGGWGELTIDGTSATAGACGYHYGDGLGYLNPNLFIQGFNGAGSTGIRRDNTLWWTESETSVFSVIDCTTGLLFDMSDGPAYTNTTLVSASAGTATFTNAGGWAIPGGYGKTLAAGMLLTGSAGITTPSTASVSTLSVTSVAGTTLTCAYTGTAPSGTPGTLTVTSSAISHGYSDIHVHVRAEGGQDGVVLANGAQVYNGSLWHRGGYASSASALTNATLRISGAAPAGHPAALTASQIARTQLDWKAESHAGVNHAFTMVFTGSGCGIFGSGGMVDFGIGTWQAASMPNNGNFQFNGLSIGDANLIARNLFFSASGTRTATVGETTVCTSGTFTVTLPNAAGLFRIFPGNRITNIGAGTITVHAPAGTLNGLSGATGDFTLTQGQTALVVSDGTNYFRVG